MSASLACGSAARVGSEGQWQAAAAAGGADAVGRGKQAPNEGAASANQLLWRPGRAHAEQKASKAQVGNVHVVQVAFEPDVERGKRPESADEAGDEAFDLGVVPSRTRRDQDGRAAERTDRCAGIQMRPFLVQKDRNDPIAGARRRGGESRGDRRFGKGAVDPSVTPTGPLPRPGC